MKEKANKQTIKNPNQEELEAAMVIPRWLVNFMVLLLQILIFGLPVAVCAIPFLYTENNWLKLLLLALTPLEFTVLFAVTAGLLSRPWQAGIIKGVFPRDIRFPIYAMRKLYSTCWTSVYYFNPLYSIILSVPLLKAITFRLFGYKGSLDINIFPDTWIRDLPLLRMEEGAYIANRAGLATNLSLMDGNTMVGHVTLKKGACAGYNSKIGLGSTIGERTEIGIDVITGLHVKIGNDSSIGAASGISHGAKIGSNTKIGVRSFIGTGAIIGDNLDLPSNIHIPDKAEVYTMEDVLKYTHEKTIIQRQVIYEKRNH